MAPHSSTLVWKLPWTEEPRRWQSMGVSKSWTQLSNFTFTFHFPALEKEMATHSSVLAWRIPETGDPGGLPSMGSHWVRHDWSNLAVAAAAKETKLFSRGSQIVTLLPWLWECPFHLTLVNIIANLINKSCYIKGKKKVPTQYNVLQHLQKPILQ